MDWGRYIARHMAHHSYVYIYIDISVHVYSKSNFGEGGGCVRGRDYGSLLPQCYKYMRGIYLCALCESLPRYIIKLRTNISRAKLIVKESF